MAGVLQERGRSARSILDIRDGCDAAILYLSADGTVTVCASNLYFFVCDGKQAARIKGQRLSIGEGRLLNKGRIRQTAIVPDPGTCFYAAADGLFDQIGGGEQRPWRRESVQNLLLARHGEPLDLVADAVWGAFEAYRGEQPRRDGVELIAFRI